MNEPYYPSKFVLLSRSLLFSIGMMISTILWGPIVVLTFPLPFQYRYRVSQQWTRFIIWWLRKTCQIDCHVSGIENLPKEPVVILAKHQSTWETFFLHQFLPPLALIVKQELLWVPFFGWALAQLNPIAINRKTAVSALKEIVKQGKKRLAQGQWVLIFPEGTRTPPGTRRPYGASGAMLAINSGCSILPVAHNAGELWQRHAFLKNPGVIEIVFGPRISSQGLKAKELNAQAEQWIENTMNKISQIERQDKQTIA
jgi:1-acyl-sn-glycerol-3-phosphate acyltransferase